MMRLISFSTKRNVSEISSFFVFQSCTSNSDGGALCCTSVTYLLIEASSFFSCTSSATNTYGGAIRFNNGNGQCVLVRVCGYACCSTYSSGRSDGQFAYITVNNNLESKNYVNYSSIAHCVNTNSDSHNSMSINNGKIMCPSVNLTNCKCQYRSAFYCYPFGDANTLTCSFTYCSITNNEALQYNCLCFGRGGAKYVIKCCNILRNKQVVVDAQGTICTWGNLNIEDSCILKNTATNIFYQGSSYKITLSNCTKREKGNFFCFCKVTLHFFIFFFLSFENSKTQTITKIRI